jgi:signal transduction histidine kinase/DNA-binding response OmpR family regulator/HPt (histidine-containing phosphotransfer) domain-containing protein
MSWIRKLVFAWPSTYTVGGFSAAFNVFLLHIGLWQALETNTQRLLFELRGPLPWDPEIVLIEADPFLDQQSYQEVVNVLLAADARLVVGAVPHIQIAADLDPKVVWASLPQASGDQASLDEKLQGGYTPPVGSNGIQTLPLFTDGVPLLGLAAAQRYQALYSGSLLPLDSQTLYLNWVEQPEIIYPLTDILRAPEAFSSQLSQKIIVIGEKQWPRIETPFGKQDHLYLEATILQNLLHTQNLSSLDPIGILILLLFGGPVLAQIASSHPNAWRMTAVLCGGWVTLGGIVFYAHISLPMIWPLVLFTATTGLVKFNLCLQKTRQIQNQVHTLWTSHHLNLVNQTSAANNLVGAPPGLTRTLNQLITLSEAFEVQALIARSLYLGLVAVNLDGEVWFCNPTASRWLHISLGDSLQDHVIPQWISHEQWQDHQRTLTQLVRQLSDPKQSLGFAAQRLPLYEVQRDDRWFMLRIEPLFAAQSMDLLGTLIVIENISKQKKMQTRLLKSELIRRQVLAEQNVALDKARRLAEAATHMKSAFLANMSHEIRTPMNAVIALTSLLMETPLNSEQRDFVETIQSSGNALIEILNEILDFSKLEAGALVLEKVPLNLRLLVESVMDLLAPQAHAKQLELVNWIHANVPDNLIGDPTRLRQILMNLIGNAIKFTHVGNITLEVTLRKKFPDYAILLFQVRDTGSGIPSQKQKILFQAFTQADPSTSRQYGGTGLGLAICKHLVKLMQGTIDVKSIEGKGSCFWFEIPLLRQKGISTLHPQVAIKDRVLVVDDLLPSRLAFLDQLHSWRVDARGVADGLTALMELRAAVKNQTPFSVVLIDVGLTGMSAESLLIKIHQDPELSETRCILLALHTQQSQIREWMSQGYAENYLLKPLKPSRLQHILKGIIDHQPEVSKVNVVAQPRKQLNISLLVAEDNPVNQKVALKQLESLGYKADVVANGHEVLEALAAKDYPLILMDCQMPLLDGYETTRQIREKAIKQPVIIAMTAHAFQEDRDRCLAAGMDDYLAKPVLKLDLEQMLYKWIPNNDCYPEKAIPESISPGLSYSSRVPLDLPALAMASGGDREFERELLTIFIDNGQAIMEAIEASIQSSAFSQIHQHAHQLKGSSTYVGAKSLQKLAGQLEQLAREEISTHNHLLFAEIKEVFQETKAFIQACYMNDTHDSQR